MSPATSLLILLACLWHVPALAQVPWVETGFAGNALLADPLSVVEASPSGRVFAATSSSDTLLVTDDKGWTWAIHKGPSAGITGMEWFEGRLFVATSGSGLFHSIDLKTWHPLSLPGNDPRSIESIDADKGIMVIKAAGDKSFYFMTSLEKGIKRVPDEVRADQNAIAPRNSQEILHLSTQGLWSYSIDGDEWTRLRDGMSVADMIVIQDTLYIGFIGSNQLSEMWKSKVGMEFKQHAVLMQESNVNFFKLYAIHDTILVAWMKDRSLPRDDIFYSYDRQLISPQATTAGYAMSDLALVGTSIYSTNREGGLMLTNSLSERWERLSRRVETSNITHLVAMPDGSIFATGSKQFLLRSTDRGETWEQRYDLRRDVTMLARSPQGTLFVGFAGGLLASTDQGKTFIGTDKGFERRTPNTLTAGPNDKLFLGTDSGLFYSTDDGTTWYMPRSENMRITSPDRFLPSVHSILYTPHDKLLYVGTNRGVILSFDEGERYEMGWLSKSTIYALKANGAGEIFAGTLIPSSPDPNARNFYRGWHVTTSVPAWIGPDSTIEHYDMDKLDVNSRGQLISGMLFSHTRGDDWEIGKLPDGSTPVSVLAQTIDSDDYAYVSTGNMVYRSAGPKLSVQAPQPAARLSLYPNPASDFLSIDMEEAGEVTIVNALGERVLTASIQPGSSIDIRRLPAGSYICQFTSDTARFRAPFFLVVR